MVYGGHFMDSYVVEYVVQIHFIIQGFMKETFDQ